MEDQAPFGDDVAQDAMRAALEYLSADDRRRVTAALLRTITAVREANEAKRELIRVLETVLPQG